MKTKSVLSRKVQLALGSASLTLLIVDVISSRGMAVCSDDGSRFPAISPSPHCAAHLESFGGFLK
jgi:hypothetical protein